MILQRNVEIIGGLPHPVAKALMLPGDAVPFADVHQRIDSLPKQMGDRHIAGLAVIEVEDPVGAFLVRRRIQQDHPAAVGDQLVDQGEVVRIAGMRIDDQRENPPTEQMMQALHLVFRLVVGNAENQQPVIPGHRDLMCFEHLDGQIAGKWHNDGNYPFNRPIFLVAARQIGSGALDFGPIVLRRQFIDNFADPVTGQLELVADLGLGRDLAARR